MTPAEKTSLTKDLARQLGFDRVGIVRLGPSGKDTYYRDWLASGYAGSMAYLHRYTDLRDDPRGLLPGAERAICVAISYNHADREAPDPAAPPAGRTSGYVRGRDYHHVLREMLGGLVERLHERLGPDFETRICVDTAPIRERELAAAAGLGWIGKNTMLLHERLGSYLFLGEILTTLELEPDNPVTDHCGRCTRCLDACPTNAFVAPHQLDASRCISYLTIEHRDEIPAEFHDAIGDWIYGCDVCQQVCPYNARAPLSAHESLTAGGLPAFIPLQELIELRSGEYRRLVKDTAANRVSRRMWQRNASVVKERRDEETP